MNWYPKTESGSWQMWTVPDTIESIMTVRTGNASWLSWKQIEMWVTCRYALCVTSPENEGQFAGFIAQKAKLQHVYFKGLWLQSPWQKSVSGWEIMATIKMHKTILLIKGFYQRWAEANWQLEVDLRCEYEHGPPVLAVDSDKLWAKNPI